MQIEFESGDIIPNPTDETFSRIKGEEFAILSTDDSDTYIQCAEQDESEEYILEYQDGSLDRHYCATDIPIQIDQIITAFRKYRDGDDSWVTDFEWERMDLS